MGMSHLKMLKPLLKTQC